MDFLDLRAATEEERKLIREILSDTSVVKIAEPAQLKSGSVSWTALPVSNARTPNQDQSQIALNQLHQTPQSAAPHQTSSQNNQSNHHTRFHDQQQTPRLQQHNSNNSSQASKETKHQPRHQHHAHYNQRIASQQTTYRNLPAVPGGPQNSPAQSANFYTNLNNDGSKNSLGAIHFSNTNITNSHDMILVSNTTTTTPCGSIIITTTNSTSSATSSSTASASSSSNTGVASPGTPTASTTTASASTTPLTSNTTLTTTANSSSSSNNIINSTSSTSTAPNSLEQFHAPNTPLNVYNHNVTRMHNQVPQLIHTAKLDSSKHNNSNNLKNQQPQPYHTQDTSQSNSPSAQSVPPLAQMPSMAGDMNTVIGMDMSSSQPPGYAIPSHVTAFGPHHVYSGPPIFQPYPYLIPLQSYMPYVLPPNSVVPPRQQVPPQNSARSNPRSQHSHSLGQQQHHPHLNVYHHHQQHQHAKQHNQVQSDLIVHNQTNHNHVNQSENETIQETNNYKPVSNGSNSNSTQPTRYDNFEQTRADASNEVYNPDRTAHEHNLVNVERPMKYTSNNKMVMMNVSSKSNHNKSRNIMTNPRLEKNLQSKMVETIDTKNSGQKNTSSSTDNQQDLCTASSSNNELQVKDSVKHSSDDGFESQSSLDISKQSQESSLQVNDFLKTRDPINKVDDKLPTSSSDVNSHADGEPFHKSVWNSAAQKSWADLFKREGQASLVPTTTAELDQSSNRDNYDEESRSKSNVLQLKGVLNHNDTTTSLREQKAQEVAKRALDEMAPNVAHKVNSIKLKHYLPFLKPRGFVNKGNGCYINATLQALIACPPFYNLMKEIGDLKGFTRANSCTPILDSFAELFSCFPPLESNKKNKLDQAQSQKLNISYLQAEPIEPKCIYNVLGQIKSECLKGAQEDAEEFLSSVLNGLHEEMIGLGEILQDSSTQNGHSSDAESNDDLTNDDNLWREVGPKNRSLPIRTAKVVNTPIQEIFGGSLFSIRTAGKDRCGHRSPFFDLQLDISGDSVESVQDAIKSFTATEVIHDFYCSKTKQKLDAQRKTLLDQLPPILILHLKQFVYSQDHGLKKLMKKIDYPIDFELPEICLHERNFSDKNLRLFNGGRAYKLLAVVYHDGKEAVKGHYLTDVYHIGSSQWIRCDDSNLKVVPAPRIENPDSFRTPYLLFYRRLNTLRAQTGNSDIKKKS